MNETKLPWAKFEWASWESDAELSLCSMAAQGFWMRCLCLAAKAKPLGHVMVKNRVPTPVEFRRLFKCQEDEAQIEGWIQELIDNGVASTSREGALISRRMIRDMRRQMASSAGGKSRQRQIIDRAEKNTVGSRYNVQPATIQAELDTPPKLTNLMFDQGSDDIEKSGVTSRQSQSQNQNQTVGTTDSLVEGKPPVSKPAPDPERGDGDFAIQAATILDVDLPPNQHVNWIHHLAQMRQAGVDPQIDLLPLIRRMKAEGKLPARLGSLRYFRDMAIEAAQARKAGAALVVAVKPDLSIEEWQTAGRVFLRCGLWDAKKCGPSPFDPGCLFPDLPKLEKFWNAQGQQPTSDDLKFYEFAGVPKPFFGSNIVTLQPKKTSLPNG